MTEPGFPKGLLFTHRGLSGPRFSRYLFIGVSSHRINVDLVPDADIATLLGSENARHQKNSATASPTICRAVLRRIL